MAFYSEQQLNKIHRDGTAVENKLYYSDKGEIFIGYKGRLVKYIYQPSNQAILDLITEAFTTALKSAYDGAVTWITTNGANLISHLTNTSNPHNVTKSQVGLGNVDNTSDLNKPISTATQTALNSKHDNPTGTPDGTKYLRDDNTWQPVPSGGISEAPNDANAYVRSALSWVIGYTKSAIDILLGNKQNTVIGVNDADLYWSTTIISGFTVTDNLDGTIDVSSGQILIRNSASETAPLELHSVSGVTSLTLNDNSVNYLYIDYNSGSPIIQLTTSIYAFNGLDKVLTHKLSREGTEVHVISLSTVGIDSNRKLRRRYIESETFTRATGLIIGQTGVRNLTITAGKVFYGLIGVDISAIDTSVADNFEQVYYSGGTWIKSTETQVNNTQYNNAGTLTTMNNNRYRVDFIYMLCDDNGGLMHLVLGDTQYNNLSSALNATLPNVLQPELVAMGILLGRIITKKNASTIEVIETAFASVFESIGVTNHYDLSNLQGGTTSEYYHLTSAEYTVVQNTSNTNTGDETASSIGAIINGAASATPNDTDLVMSVESSVAKKNTWTQIKTFLKTYLDTLYEPIFSKNTAFNKNFGTTSGTVAEGNDSRFELIKNLYTRGGLFPSTPHTGTTSITRIETCTIPANTFAVGDVVRIRARLYRISGTASSIRIRIYWNNSPTTLSNHIAMSQLSTAQYSGMIKRDFPIQSNTTITNAHSTNSVASDDLTSVQSLSTLTIADITADSYIHFAIELLNAADSAQYDFMQIIKHKQV